MEMEKTIGIVVDSHVIVSANLGREVIVDVYFPTHILQLPDMGLLLINDGQNLPEMGFANMLEEMYQREEISPLLCVGIYCGDDRKNEYGTSGILDYKGRGTKAAAYTAFIFDELIPFIRDNYQVYSFKEKSFCGFSLGALSALAEVRPLPADQDNFRANGQ